MTTFRRILLLRYPLLQIHRIYSTKELPNSFEDAGFDYVVESVLSESLPETGKRDYGLPRRLRSDEGA